jgi:histidinol phosphatase-like enzyme
MIERAKAELNLDVEHSYVVGDMTIDVEFARNAGCRSVLVKTGKGGTDGRYKSPPTFVANDLFDAAKLILEDYEQRTK